MLPVRLKARLSSIKIPIFFIINNYSAQIPCEYDQMRVTNKYDTN